MGAQRFARIGRLWRGVAAAAVVVLVPVVVAGGGQASAAAGRSGQNAAGASGVASAGGIATVAGGVGGPGKATQVGLPGACGVSLAGGYLYIADGGAVRKVSAGTDGLTTLAGTGAAHGPLGDGGFAAKATIGTCGAVVDVAGNLVLADASNRVRVVAAGSGTFYGQAMTAGHIYSVAGGGTGGLGDGGPATSAKLDFSQCGIQVPSCSGDVAVDAAGNLVIADDGHNRVRVVAASSGTFYGQAMTAGDIYTVAGGGAGGLGDGGPATSAKLSGPSGVAVDGRGNLVIADTGHNRARVVAASSGTFYGQAMTAGDIYTVAGNGVGGFSGDGGPATSAELSYPYAATADAAGNLVIADSYNSRVRVVAGTSGSFYGQAMTAGHIYTVAGGGTGGLGDGGPATSATLSGPQGVAVDGAGNLVIADDGDHRVRVVAASTGTLFGKSMTAGDIYTVAGNGAFGEFSGDGGLATSAQLSFAEGVAADAAGNLMVADTYNNRVRMVAASTGTFYGQAMAAGDIYTIAGNGKTGFSGDGGPAASAKLYQPGDVAVDAAGNLVVADSFNNRVRVVAASTGSFYGQAMTAGDIYTVAGNGTLGFSGDGGPAASAKLSNPYAVAVDTAGNLVIADSENSRVRVVAASTGSFYGQAMTAGDIYTVAGNGAFGFSGDGGPATTAELDGPSAVAVDAFGNLIITDSGNSRVRVIAASTGSFYGQAMTAGDIYTIAGDGTLGFSGDGGPATSAELNFSEFGVQVQGGVGNLAVDAAGNLAIGDTGNSRVRIVTESTGSFYGQAMTAGDIYTVAGNGKVGFSGDGGSAARAELDLPEGVAVAAGNLMIADSFNYRIRTVLG